MRRALIAAAIACAASPAAAASDAHKMGELYGQCLNQAAVVYMASGEGASDVATAAFHACKHFRSAATGLGLSAHEWRALNDALRDHLIANITKARAAAAWSSGK